MHDQYSLALKYECTLLQRLIVRLSYHEPVLARSPSNPLHRLFMFGIKFYGHEKKGDSSAREIDYILCFLFVAVFKVKCEGFWLEFFFNLQRINFNRNSNLVVQFPIQLRHRNRTFA